MTVEPTSPAPSLSLPLEDLRVRREVAVIVAREAADLLLAHAPAVRHAARAGAPGSSAEVTWKGVGDLVTAADQAAETLVLARLAAAFPGDALVGEEGGGTAPNGAEWLWYIDPLDGTTNYVHGLPHYGVSLGALYRGQPAVGVIAAPELDRVWSAGLGLGASVEPYVRRGSDAPRALRVSPVTRLEQALVGTGFPYDRSRHAAELVAPLRRALERCLCVRRLGSAAVDLALVADGTFGAFWESRLKPWDIAAGVVLVREAGGRVSDHLGGPDLFARCDIVASNGHLHQAMLDLVLAASPPGTP